MKLDHKTASKVASEVLEKEGYEVFIDKKVKDDFSIDLFAVRGSEAVAIEFKPETRIDTFDVMTFKSYISAIEADPSIQSVKVHKLLVYKDVTLQAGTLSKSYGIELIAATKPEEFAKELLKATKK